MGSKFHDEGWAVAVDSSGNVYTAGYFADTTDFDPGPGKFMMTSAGGDDIFITKFDFAGKFIWAKRIGGSQHDFCSAIACDRFGNIYLTGDYIGTVDFNPGAGTSFLTSNFDQGFLLKLNSAGDFVWVKRFGQNGSFSTPNCLAVDSIGNVYTSGLYTKTCDFDPGSATFNLQSKGGVDIFITKYTPAGNFIWARSVGGPTNSEGLFSLALDKQNNVYTTGYTYERSDFDPGPDSFFFSSPKISTFILKLSGAGNFIWAKQIVGSSAARSIHLDKNYNVFLTGNFEDTVDFDPGASKNIFIAQLVDAYILKMDSSGKFGWVKRIGGKANEFGFEINTDAAGNIYTCGIFSNIVDFDPGSGTYFMQSSSQSTFTLKLSNTGSFIWAKMFTADVIESLFIDKNMDVFITGRYYGELYTDSADRFIKIATKSKGDADGFVLKMGVCDFSLKSIPKTIKAAVDSSLKISLSISGVPRTFSWQRDTGTGFKNLFDGGQFSGTSTDTLRIKNLVRSQNNSKYRCLITGKKCNSVSDTILLEVLCKPQIVKQPSSINALAGDTVKIGVIALNALSKFQWQVDTGSGFQNLSDGTDYFNTTKDSLIIRTINRSQDKQQLRVVVNDKGCVDTSQIVNVSVNCPKLISIQPQNINAIAGKMVKFNIETLNYPATYLWQVNKGVNFDSIGSGGNYSGITKDTLQISKSQLSQNKYLFRCITSFAGCLDTSSHAELRVACDLRITTHPVNQAGKVGENVQFIIAVSDSIASLQWQLSTGSAFTNLSNGAQIAGAQEDTLILKNLSLAQKNSIYRCVISEGECHDTSNTALLQISAVQINNTILNKAFTVYPNPVSDILYIQSKENHTNFKYKMLDKTGKIMLNGEHSQGLQGIDISTLKSGLYIFEIEYGSKIMFKVIKL